MPLSLRGNRLIYALWSPIYDGLFDRFFAAPGRRRALQLLDAKPGERVLLTGVGTGADLPLLPRGVCAVGLDYSPQMLSRARGKATRATVDLLLGDAQLLPLPADRFDAAVLNLILSVAPDGRMCWRETLRAVRPGGRLVVFDKFAPEAARPTPLRRLLNRLTEFFGTDITRRFGAISADTPCRLVRDEPSLLGGAYRIKLLQKTGAVAET